MPLAIDHSGDEGMSTRVRSVSVVSGMSSKRFIQGDPSHAYRDTSDGNLNAAISRVCLDIEFRSFWSRDYLRSDCFLVFALPMYFPLQCMLFVLLKAHLRPLLADWEMLPKAASCTAGAESMLSSLPPSDLRGFLANEGAARGPNHPPFWIRYRYYV